MAVYFALKLTRSDRPILEGIREFFGGIGRIYDVNANASSIYRVTRVAELVLVVKHFDAYPLQTHKRGVYEVWRDMVELKRDFRAANHAKLEALALELSARRAR